jgi:hypothetical protein
MLHSQGIGKIELSPPIEAESPLLADLRMACSDGDPLWTIPMNAALETIPSGDRLLLSKWSSMNSGSSKWMVMPQESSMSNR